MKVAVLSAAPAVFLGVVKRRALNSEKCGKSEKREKGSCLNNCFYFSRLSSFSRLTLLFTPDFLLITVFNHASLLGSFP
jgi:hypothetical protein